MFLGAREVNDLSCLLTLPSSAEIKAHGRAAGRAERGGFDMASPIGIPFARIPCAALSAAIPDDVHWRRTRGPHPKCNDARGIFRGSPRGPRAARGAEGAAGAMI